MFPADVNAALALAGQSTAFYVSRHTGSRYDVVLAMAYLWHLLLVAPALLNPLAAQSVRLGQEP